MVQRRQRRRDAGVASATPIYQCREGYGAGYARSGEHIGPEMVRPGAIFVRGGPIETIYGRRIQVIHILGGIRRFVAGERERGKRE